LGPVSAPVVSHNDFALNVMLAQGLLGFPDAGFHRISLIQAGHHNGYFWRKCLAYMYWSRHIF
jgi:hypothetical protein